MYKHTHVYAQKFLYRCMSFFFKHKLDALFYIMLSSSSISLVELPLSQIVQL